MERISQHVSYAEGIKSQEAIRAGVDNTPDQDQLRAMRLVAEKCFEPLRRHHGKPIGITSFFLIAFYRERYLPVKNALKVFSFYRVADVFLLLGIWICHAPVMLDSSKVKLATAG